jgi:Glycosyl transferases group 1
MPLGFSPEHFSYVPEVRKRVRAELKVAGNEILVCVSSHFDAVKAVFVNMIIDALNEVMKADANVRGLIVGFSDKPGAVEHSRAIEQHIEHSQFAERFIRQPFANRSRLAELYNASDIAAFGRPSISCQEALGTGLVGCFADDGAVNHLVTDPEQGVFFQPGDRSDLAAKLASAAQSIGRHQGEARDAFRARLASAARWLGYDRIIQATMDELQRRLETTDVHR